LKERKKEAEDSQPNKEPANDQHHAVFKLFHVSGLLLYDCT
jgi:hypothetical protein